MVRHKVNVIWLNGLEQTEMKGLYDTTKGLIRVTFTYPLFRIFAMIGLLIGSTIGFYYGGDLILYAVLIPFFMGIFGGIGFFLQWITAKKGYIPVPHNYNMYRTKRILNYYVDSNTMMPVRIGEVVQADGVKQPNKPLTVCVAGIALDKRQKPFIVNLVQIKALIELCVMFPQYCGAMSKGQIDMVERLVHIGAGVGIGAIIMQIIAGL